MASVKDAMKSVRRQISEKTQEKAISLWNGLTAVTPVDTGRARASWRLTVGSVDTSAEPAGSDNYVLSQPTLPTPDGKENVYYITNNVPYILPLNNGHSQQAGEFFVEREVARVVGGVA